MTLNEEMAADLAELEVEISPDGVTPHSFNHNGIDYPCTPGSVRRSRTLGSGGYELDADLVLFVRAELFPTPAEHELARPAPKERLTYLGKNYLVADLVVPAGEPFLKLVCVDPSRRL